MDVPERFVPVTIIKRALPGSSEDVPAASGSHQHFSYTGSYKSSQAALDPVSCWQVSPERQFA